ncbi:MAG: mannose-1-phosphate guanylyltransferase [Planctomycetota bacterium]|nr:MAG: mannose-1-phosphate guanylyltransferase [Planctomycetota bacterium]
MRHGVIMAGGAGVRLWPLSRKQRPKQILKLFGGKSLLRQSFERVTAVLEPERVYVITNDQHLSMVAEELPEIPRDNLIGEPVGRDTANAVGLSAGMIAERDPEAVIGMFTADHIITPVDQFRRSVLRAFETAEQHPDALVTMGIRPSRPDTNYGYIRRGESIAPGVFEVKKFTEKPSVATAMRYLASGEYYWNSGMFTWRACTILDELQKHLPQSFEAIRRICETEGKAERKALLEKLYPDLLKISIDFAVMERASRVLAVEMDCQWVDVGSFPALESVVEGDRDGNISVCERVVHLGSRGNIVVSEERHLIATIGVEDLVIVHSPDATLICKRRDATAIKELVDNIRAEFGEEYI